MSLDLQLRLARATWDDLAYVLTDIWTEAYEAALDEGAEPWDAEAVASDAVKDAEEEWSEAGDAAYQAKVEGQ